MQENLWFSNTSAIFWCELVFIRLFQMRNSQSSSFARVCPRRCHRKLLPTEWVRRTTRSQLCRSDHEVRRVHRPFVCAGSSWRAPDARGWAAGIHEYAKTVKATCRHKICFWRFWENRPFSIFVPELTFSRYDSDWSTSDFYPFAAASEVFLFAAWSRFILIILAWRAYRYMWSGSASLCLMTYDFMTLWLN